MDVCNSWVTSFNSISGEIKKHPDAMISDNLVTGGKNIKVGALTLVDNSNSPSKGSNCLKLYGEGDLIKHSFNDETWVEGSGIEEVNIGPLLGQMHLEVSPRPAF